MPPILVPSSAKRIATQIVAIAKLNGRKDFFLEALFVISFVPARNYLFKVSNLSTRITCESCSILRMSILTIFQRCSSVFIVKCEHISNFLLIVEFEQVNVCLVHIEKSNTFEGKIEYIMRYVVIICVCIKFIDKQLLNLYHHNPTSESVRNFCEGVYFRR